MKLLIEYENFDKTKSDNKITINNPHNKDIDVGDYITLTDENNDSVTYEITRLIFSSREQFVGYGRIVGAESLYGVTD